MQQFIQGKKVMLRPAAKEDRQFVFEWLACSDLTSSMLGPPDFPDNPVPTWEEFINDYSAHFFDGSNPGAGRCFIILVSGEPIGQVNYNEICAEDRSTELDIWLSHSRHTGKGYGTDALETLCKHLSEEFDIRRFIIAPSARNIRAVKSYRKAGFAEVTIIPDHFIPDYKDTVVMEK